MRSRIASGMSRTGRAASVEEIELAGVIRRLENFLALGRDDANRDRVRRTPSRVCQARAYTA